MGKGDRRLMIKSGQNAFEVKTEFFFFFLEQDTTQKYALKFSAPHILPLQKQSEIENGTLFRLLDCKKKQNKQTVAVNLLLTRYRNGVSY